MPLWLLQTNPPKLAERVTTPMAWALKNLDIPFRGFQVDLMGEHEAPRILFDDELDVPRTAFLYGSVRALHLALEDPAWTTRLAFDSSRFDFRAWKLELGDSLWNSGASVMQFGEALSAWQSGRRHLRPVGDLKLFKGVFCDRENLETLLIQGKGQLPDADEWVVLSPPHLPFREWRCVVVGGDVVTAGCYMEDGRVRASEDIAPPTVWKRASEICRIWLPSPFCTLDLAEDKQGNLRLLEFNCLHASGFYHLDRKAIAMAIESAWS
jgi:hypothetical protein